MTKTTPTLEPSNWITTETPAAIGSLLQDHAIFADDEAIEMLEVAGEGNMNVTLRATSNSQSLIVKQPRPFVAKYDSIPAPINRTHYEALFYQRIQSFPELATAMPQLIAWMPEQSVLVLQDLGPATDATLLYHSHRTPELPPMIQPLLRWITRLHWSSQKVCSAEEFRNMELRKLNHAHIFQLPFQDPPVLDLNSVCCGLRDATQPLRSNFQLAEKAQILGERYLGEGRCLLHGDFYPGSWLVIDNRPTVIDPEFCFMGPPEFDLGVLTGHLLLMGCESPRAEIQALLEGFSDGETVPYEWSLVGQFAYVEVLRRLLGVAQLPLDWGLEQRIRMVDFCAQELLACG